MLWNSRKADHSHRLINGWEKNPIISIASSWLIMMMAVVVLIMMTVDKGSPGKIQRFFIDVNIFYWFFCSPIAFHELETIRYTSCGSLKPYKIDIAHVIGIGTFNTHLTLLSANTTITRSETIFQKAIALLFVFEYFANMTQSIAWTVKLFLASIRACFFFTVAVFYVWFALVCLRAQMERN